MTLDDARKLIRGQRVWIGPDYQREIATVVGMSDGSIVVVDCEGARFVLIPADVTPIEARWGWMP